MRLNNISNLLSKNNAIPLTEAFATKVGLAFWLVGRVCVGGVSCVFTSVLLATSLDNYGSFLSMAPSSRCSSTDIFADARKTRRILVNTCS